MRGKKGKKTPKFEDSFMASMQENPTLMCVTAILFGLIVFLESNKVFGATSTVGAYVSVVGLTFMGLGGLILFRLKQRA